jgi:ethanolamine utilization microcompartment shell protein EutS
VKQSKLSVHNKVGDMVKHEGLELQILYKDKESGGDVLLGTLAAIEAIAEALKVNTVLTICNLLKNDLDIKSATMLAEIGKEKRIMLSGIKHDQTEAKFGGYTLQPAEGILIASDLRVSLVLSSLSLHLNGISNEGAKAIAEALSSSGRAVQTNLNLAGNPLGPSSGIGPEGARAIAEALRFKALLKELECARFSGTSNANRAARASPHTIACTLAFLSTSRNPLTHTRDSNALRSLKYDHLNDEKKGELRAVAKAILTIEM